MSSFDHMKAAIDIIFNNPDSTRKFIWNPWAEREIKEFLQCPDEKLREYKERIEAARCKASPKITQGDPIVYNKREDKFFLGVAGCASAGKSDPIAMAGIMMYLSNPTETLVLCTSTTVEMAKLRIWKAVREYWNQVENYFKSQNKPPPGKAVHSKCVIRGYDASGEISDITGLRLVAADKKKGEEATSGLMGAKVPGKGLLLLIADELPDLAPNILTVAYTNLINNYQFWMVGIGNPNLKRDPFGKFCEPRDGWDSVKHEPDEWFTERGKVIRLDARRNPNLDRTDNKYFWMPTQASIDACAKQYGENSRYYYRMFVGMWASDKAPNAIYSESELLPSCTEEEPKWDYPPTLIGVGLDSSFTSGGDRSVNVPGKFGVVNGKKHLHVLPYETLDIEDKKGLSPSHQIAQAWIHGCKTKGVPPRAAGFDNSGAGKSFGHIIDMDWSPNTKKIEFGGKASGRPYILDGDTQEEFYNRVSELWIQPKTYFRAGQITGMSPDIVDELVERQLHDTYSGAKLRVEEKKKMKGRIGKSPDLADGFVILVEVGIQNGWLDSVEQKTILKRADAVFQEKRKTLKIKQGRRPKMLRR